MHIINKDKKLTDRKDGAVFPINKSLKRGLIIMDFPTLQKFLTLKSVSDRILL